MQTHSIIILDGSSVALGAQGSFLQTGYILLLPLLATRSAAFSVCNILGVFKVLGSLRGIKPRRMH